MCTHPEIFIRLQYSLRFGLSNKSVNGSITTKPSEGKIKQIFLVSVCVEFTCEMLAMFDLLSSCHLHYSHRRRLEITSFCDLFIIDTEVHAMCK
jgi:hypothetical protein